MNGETRRQQPGPTYGGAAAANVRTVHQHVCPECQGLVYRIPRRGWDCLVSLLRPVRRYACQAPGCGWEGTLRCSANEKRHPGASSGRVYRI